LQLPPQSRQRLTKAAPKSDSQANKKKKIRWLLANEITFSQGLLEGF
jgi:hypothetical protein